MPEDYFDGPVAEAYDSYAAISDPAVVDPAVDFLAALAGDGRALEFAIGTGRIGLRLHQRGVPVVGIDLSPAMVAQLRAKPGARDIEVTVGDMATTTVAGTFRLVYLVYNTIQNLTTQDEQVDCFANAARHLEPGGRFVIEVEVPQLQRLPPGDIFRVFEVSATHVGVDELDIARQRGVSHHYVVDDDRAGNFPTPFRYVWPSELDLMARLAGLRLRERWGDWRRAPFTSDSAAHVSVWEKTFLSTSPKTGM